MFVSKGRFEDQKRQTEFWQGLFEDERLRADRLMDRILEIHGQYPVSAEAVENKKVNQAKAEEVMESMKEVYAMETPIDEVFDPSKIVEAEQGFSEEE